MVAKGRLNRRHDVGGCRQKKSPVEIFSTEGEKFVSLRASGSEARQALQTECPKRSC